MKIYMLRDLTRAVVVDADATEAMQVAGFLRGDGGVRVLVLNNGADLEWLDA